MPVGYLFTDIEGSVERWEASPKRMADAVARHDTIVDACVAHCGGVIKDRAGDGVFAMFPKEGNAIACALAIQLGVSKEDWSAVGGLRLRIGVHATPAHSAGLVDRTAANRASRIMETCAGGQTVVSEVAAKTYALPAAATLTDFGVCYLRGVPDPVRLFGLHHPELPPGEFPPLRSQFRIVGTLPLKWMPLFGRDRDVGIVADALERTRLVSIVGPGGNGKTRLAIEIGRQWEKREPVLFLSLRGVNSAADLVSTLGEALRFPFREKGAHEEQLREYLRDKRALLILDNADGVVGQADFISALVSQCNDLSVLATCREPLCAPNEFSHRLGGMSAEDRGELEAARRIFMHAARAREPDFKLDEADLLTFKALCQRVGGSPLALRLMAQWTPLLSLDELRLKTDAGLDFLRSTTSEEEHHRTLRGVFDESWRRLDSQQCNALAAFSVFHGAFDWKLAEAVLATPLDVFRSLEQKGLIESTGGRHFHLHPLVAGYAREKLALNASAERSAFEAHRRYFLRFLQHQMGAFREQGQGETIDVLTDLLPDIRAAWFDAVRSQDHALVESAIEPLCYCLIVAARLREGAAWFGEAAKLSKNAALASHCRAVSAAFLVQQGGLSEAVVLANQVLASKRVPKLALAHAHTALATAAHTRGDFSSAQSHYKTVIDIRRAEGDRIGLVFAYLSLGALNIWRGNAEDAREPVREGFALAGEVGLALGLIVAHMFSGDIALAEGREEDARASFMQGLEMERTARNAQYRAQLLRRAGSLALRMRRLDEAEQHHTEALELLLDLGDRRGQAQAYIDLGNDSLARENFGAARDRYLRGISRSGEIASEVLRDVALLGCARTELAAGNRLLAARLVRFLCDSEGVKSKPEFVTASAALQEEASSAPPSSLNELLDEVARLSSAHALKL